MSCFSSHHHHHHHISFFFLSSQSTRTLAMRLSTARLSTATTLRTAPKCAARRPFHTLQSFRSLPRSACFAQTHLTTSTSLTATFQSKNVQQSRGVKTLDFGGTKEKVVERSDYPKEKLQKIFAKDTMAVIGYGVQGMAQSLNMKDHGLNVIVGVRQGGKSWNKAIEDGWVPGKTLFPIEEAAQKGTVIMYLLSDAGQKESWPTVKPHLTKGKTLYFSHGFSVVYKEDTKVEPPKDIDVILVAPKGSGTTVRRLFLDGQGINSSVAVFQDASGQAQERAYALGIAVGSGYLYDTTFEKEVYSDLTGERGVLMGAIYGLFRAQYDVLRSKGTSLSPFHQV
ncbi:Bifunctional acetohydroxyacid reductoisomerase [Balamuthia mandrillaris]